MTLRKNLVYSNGKAVKASDFTYSIERALKLNWGGDPFYTGYIVGATAYQKGTSKTISGSHHQRRDRDGHDPLLSAYGPFENILAFPSSGFVPTGTIMKVTNTAPPGVGPYMITNIVPTKSWDGDDQPLLRQGGDPGDPGRPRERGRQGREQHDDRDRGRAEQLSRPVRHRRLDRTVPCSRRSSPRTRTGTRRPGGADVLLLQ